MKRNFYPWIFLMLGFAFAEVDGAPSEKGKITGYEALRAAAMKTTLKDLGMEEGKDQVRVYGVAMDLALENGTVTLVSFISGEARLLFSGGSDKIEGGAYASVRMAATKLVRASEFFVSAFQETKTYPLPTQGEIRFYLITTRGVMTCIVDEKKVRGGRDDLSALFLKANDVITEIRTLDQRLK